MTKIKNKILKPIMKDLLKLRINKVNNIANIVVIIPYNPCLVTSIAACLSVCHAIYKM